MTAVSVLAVALLVTGVLPADAGAPVEAAAWSVAPIGPMASVDIDLVTPQAPPSGGSPAVGRNGEDGIAPITDLETAEDLDDDGDDDDSLGADVMRPSITEITTARHDSRTPRTSSLKPLTATQSRC